MEIHFSNLSPFAEKTPSADDANFILVVGGLGYIGSHTTLELLKEGYNVIVVDDLSNSYNEVLDRIKKLANEHYAVKGGVVPIIRSHYVDYRSPQMRTILASYAASDESPLDTGDQSRITGVIHFAAYKSVEESIAQPLRYYKNNVSGFVDFLGLLEEFGIKNFVFSSSATVYGTQANRGVALREENLVHFPETYVEEDGTEVECIPGAMGLTSPYGRSKYMCECILADLAKSDPSWKITALRYFNPVGCHESGLLGEDPRQKPTNLIPVINRVLTGQSQRLKVFGTDWDTEDGTAVRDFIHVVDLARGHIAAVATAAAGKSREPFRAYNLGTGKGHTVREVVGSMQKASGKDIPCDEVGRRPGDVGFCIAGVSRANEELEWKTQKSLDDCTTDVWNFIKKRCSVQLQQPIPMDVKRRSVFMAPQELDTAIRRFSMAVPTEAVSQGKRCSVQLSAAPVPDNEAVQASQISSSILVS